MSEVTGFTHRAITLDSLQVTPTAAVHEMGLTNSWGSPKQTIQTFFTIEASSTETLAVFTDGSPAVAFRRNRRGLDIFVGVPALTPELVRAFAQTAEVHLFTAVNVAVWAVEGCLSTQAHATGRLAIQTGRSRTVVDALTGAELGRGPSLTLPMEAGDMRLLRYGAVRP